MGFWNIVGDIAISMKDRVVKANEEAKEIQQKKMIHLSDEEVLTVIEKGNMTSCMAANMEARERGIK